MPGLTEWLINLGITEDLLMILTFVPILVTLTTISRYITGVKTFGIYGSMILAFAYYFMGARQGMIITGVVIAASWITRNLIKKVQLHYLSRLAIVYGAISIVVLLFIVATSFIPNDAPVFDFRYLRPLPFVMIVSITDRFMTKYIKKDLFTAMRLTAETMLIAVIGWALMRIGTTHRFMVNNLWIIPLTIVINYFVGKYSGIRWTEFIRFGRIINTNEKQD
jgi:hypothetical protein